MKIKKLDIVGFKSFKDRTVIQFDAGITGVVGPNGCGKSNIVDALIWVMGEMSAKHLRGSSMEDVIFAGADGFAPAGMCEVSLTLENDGGPFPVKYASLSEVMVTRQLHRSGESSYMINKEPARLKDIQEIFMDTGAGAKGFSIIAQGMISQIITQKPEERRRLIEEAAGITKFKVRKRESIRKLESTDQNLVRLNDIVIELKRQMDSLERQAEKADRYRKLKAELEDIELSLATKEYFRLTEDIAKFEGKFSELNQSEASDLAGSEELELKISALRLQLVEDERLVQAEQLELAELQRLVQKSELDLRELRFEIEQAHRTGERAGSLLEEHKTRQQILQIELADLVSRFESAKADTESLKEDFQANKSQFDLINARIIELDHALTEKRKSMLLKSQLESALQAKISATETQISELEDQCRSEQEEFVGIETKFKEFDKRKNRLINDLESEKQLRLDISRDVETFEANKKNLEVRVLEKQQEIASFKDELNVVTSRLYGLENLASSFEGFQEGVKHVMLWQKSRTPAEEVSESHLLRPMAEVVEVPKEYELAMEAALGSRLQVLLANDSESSLQALQFLKDEKKGRSSFMAPQTASQRSLQMSPGLEQVSAILSEVVSIPEAHRESAMSLLGQVAVVESMSQALSLRPQFPDWTFVTTEGETLSSDGIMTGGSAESADSGFLKRKREIKELIAKKDEWAGKLSLAQVALKKVEAQLQTLSSDWLDAQKRQQDQEIRLAELKKDLERAEVEAQTSQAALVRQSQNVDRLNAKMATLTASLEDFNEQAESTRFDRHELEIEIEALTLEYHDRKSGVEGLQSLVTELQVKLARRSEEFEGLQRQKKMLEESLSQVSQQIQRTQSEAHESSSSLSENEKLIQVRKVELDHLIHRVEEVQSSIEQKKNSFEVSNSDLRKQEERLTTFLREQSALQSKLNEVQMKLEQRRMQLDHLAEQIREKYLLILAEHVEKYREREFDDVEFKARLSDLKGQISRIGEVNLSAIQEYEQIKERYQYLKQQQDDLIEAKDQLLKVIDKINKVCTERFTETFEAVNERFEKVFPVLFGGGEAKLTLVVDESKDDSEMGIDIMAKPPGKKMQSVTLMSGGEKALTAVSLIFAIFLVKPSPYCLLDEVDAPLDDANVSRFNDLVNEMAKRSQIILVTHNKHTMEIAGRLYGVTMQDKGVSKMVSVDLERAQAVSV